MRRLTTGAIATLLTIALTATVAAATDPSRTEYQATGLAGHPELRSSSVLDVTFDRERGAMEHHQVSGAAADTTYDLVASVFFARDCAPDFGVVQFPEGTLTTDEHGNGRTVVHFPGNALAGAPDRFWVSWSLVAGGDSAYRSGCVQVDLGS